MSILLIDFDRLNSSKAIVLVCMASSFNVDVEVDAKSNLNFGMVYGLVDVDGFDVCLSNSVFVSAVPLMVAINLFGFKFIIIALESCLYKAVVSLLIERVDCRWCNGI